MRGAAEMLDVDIRAKWFPAIAAVPARQVLGPVAFKVAPGERVCLFGPSGCGKSTTLNLISGLDMDVEGRIERSGGRLAFVFQEPRLLPWRTCAENVALVLKGAPDARRAATRWLEEMGVAASADTYPQRLSLGMARRVSMARAFAVDPALLILDEPFASLDRPTATRLRDLLLATAIRQGTAVIAVTHDPLEAAIIGHRVLVMGGSPTTVVREVRIDLDEDRRHDLAALEGYAATIAG